MILITTLAALADHPESPLSLLDGVGEVSHETARLLSCHADLVPVVTGRNDAVLDVGRTRREPTSRQLAALAARDQRCVGCAAPISRCQAHHIVHWAKGGPTNLGNLCLLCTNCHFHVHHHGWEVVPTPQVDRSPTTPSPFNLQKPWQPDQAGPPGNGASGRAPP